MSSLYQQHIARWKDCNKCSLCESRNRVVFARGKIPCDVLFVGEAPDESENVTGDPFDGPAGSKLDYIISDVITQLSFESNEPSYNLRMGFYNLVGCYPAEAKKTGNHEPPIEAIKACAGKLREFVVIAAPKLIVTVGKLSDKWTPEATNTIPKNAKDKAVQWTSITHPAAILRAPMAQQSLLVKKCIVTLTHAFRNL